MHCLEIMNKIQKIFILLSLTVFISITVNGQKSSTKAEALQFRVEPPSWWASMQNPSLQLLVYGKDISKASLTMDYPGVSLVKKSIVENPNYLFLDLEISPEAMPGSFNLTFKEGKKTVFEYSYVLNERKPGSASRKGFGADDVIYLLMPDRFANGNPSNDNMNKCRLRCPD